MQRRACALHVKALSRSTEQPVANKIWMTPIRGVHRFTEDIRVVPIPVEGALVRIEKNGYFWISDKAGIIPLFI